MNCMFFACYVGDGEGFASLTFSNGVVYGYDPMGGQYDGLYTVTNLDDVFVQMRIKIPANVSCVAGGISRPYDWLLRGKFVLKNGVDNQTVEMKTDVGIEVTLHLTKMRDLPEAA